MADPIWNDNPELRDEAEAESAKYRNGNGKTNGHTGAGHGAEWKASPWDHPLEPLATLDFTTLDDNPSFAREWAVTDWFPMLETVGLGGPGGEGKTLLAQMFSTASALGEGCLGLPFTAMKTTLVLCEDYLNDAHLRQADINRKFGCKMADLAGQLRIMPRRKKLYNHLGIFDSDGNLHTTSFFDQLVTDLKQFGSKFTVLDGRSDIFRGNQNDEHHARSFVRKVTDRIAQETEGAVVMIYQPSRAGRVDGTGESGSAQWDAAFRARCYLAPAGKDDDRDIRHFTRKKSNFSAKDEEISIRWEQGVFVRADAAGEPVKPAYEVAAERAKAEAQRARAEQVFLRRLDSLNRLNYPVSSSKNAGNYAPRRFSEHPDLNEGCTFAELERAMTDLMLMKGLITNEQVGRFTRIVKVAEPTT